MKGCSLVVKSRFSTLPFIMVELLIIKPSSLGDIIHALQVATSLKSQLKGLRISWISREVFAPIVEASDVVDQVYIFERNGGTKGFLLMMKEVRRTKFDYVFDMQGLLRTGLMISRTRSDFKVGRSDSREMSEMFYDEKVPLPESGRRSHALDILLQFCPVFKVKPELRGALKFKSKDYELKFEGHDDVVKPIVIFPDSRRAEKKWGAFRQLSKRLLASPKKRRVVWVGNKFVTSRGVASSRFLNLTGKTDIDDLPSLIQQASWVIANDSGPMHLAAAMGVNTIGIFGPTDPALYGPYANKTCHTEVIQAAAGNLKLLQAKVVYDRFMKAEKRLEH